VPKALVDNSVFSARTIYAEHVSETQRDIVEALDGKLGAAEIRTRMGLRLKKLGYQPVPGEERSIKDLSSDLRTNLIIEHQTANARGYAVWRSQQRESIMTLYPAQELYRAESRNVPRKWGKRWNDARRDLGEARTSATYAASDNGPFVAKKNDPIWVHPYVNRFGNPWTPFDFRSGMRLRQTMAQRARDMGVPIAKGEVPAVHRDPMRRVQSSSAAGIPEPVLKEWMKPFGDRAMLHSGRVLVAPEGKSILTEIAEAAAAGHQAQAVFGFVDKETIAVAGKLLTKAVPADTVYQVSADELRHISKQHGDEMRAGQRSVSTDDITAIPETLKNGKWRESTKQEKGSFTGDGMSFVADNGVRLAFRVSRKKNNPHWSLHTMWIETKAGAQAAK